MIELEKTILYTLNYFDLFDQPLTSFEIWKYLWNPTLSPTSFDQIQNELNNLVLSSKIIVKDGFYFLSAPLPYVSQSAGLSREHIILLRKKRFQISKIKLDKARFLVKFFKHIPYLRGIFVCNRVSSSTASENSDIDLFIITENGRLWTVRFLTTLFLKVFGLRPSKKQSCDKFCVSFYVGIDNLSLQNCLLKEKDSWPDIHFIYWLADFLPLYDEGLIPEFVRANSWVKNYLPNLELTSDSSILLKSKRSPFKFFIEIFSKIIRIADFRERMFKNIQLHILPEPLKQTVRTRNTNVIISDQILKFHLNDRREEYRDKFLKKLVKLILVDKKH